MTAFQAHDLILITGGTGFAGKHLVTTLHQKGYTNLHVTHVTPPPTDWPSEWNVQFHQLDLTDAEATVALFEKLKPRAIYQLASIAAVGKSFEQGEMILRNNLLVQRNVLEAFRQAVPQARLLSVGSAEEYGYVGVSVEEATRADQHLQIDEKFPLRPMNPYAVSKAAQDLLADAYFLSHQLDIVRVRPFNHIGTGQSPDFVVPAFASQIASIEKGKVDVLKIGNVEVVRDFSDARDVVAAYVVIMEKGQSGEVYNIGSGHGWKIAEILDTLIALSTATIRTEIDKSRLRPTDVPYFVADSRKVKALGWTPTYDIKNTLADILNEWRTRV